MMNKPNKHRSETRESGKASPLEAVGDLGRCACAWEHEALDYLMRHPLKVLACASLGGVLLGVLATRCGCRHYPPQRRVVPKDAFE